jgi:2-oxoglutarate dehydrogenase E2 component (dihydrolipoamide succinyltransferase)
MKFGLDTAAQLTTVMEVDVTRVAALRARAKSGFAAREGVNLSFLPFFVKAALEAAKAYPVINSTITADLKEITYHGNVNLGIAVDTPRGLIVPVIKAADDLNIAGLARKIADLAARTRDNKIGPDELSGGTFTVTNTGSVGSLFDTPILVPPQSAILGTGGIGCNEGEIGLVVAGWLGIFRVDHHETGDIGADIVNIPRDPVTLLCCAKLNTPRKEPRAFNRNAQ